MWSGRFLVRFQKSLLPLYSRQNRNSTLKREVESLNQCHTTWAVVDELALGLVFL